MKKEYDGYYAWFYGEELSKFKDFYEAREKNTRRIKIPAEDLRFLTVGQAKKWYKTDQELASRLGVEEDLVKDTEANLDMIVVLKEKGERVPYLVGHSSWISIKNRIDIYGKGFDMLGSEEQVRDINRRFSQLGDEEVQVIIADDKVRAIMSRMYAVIPTADLFNFVLDYSWNRFDGFELVEAYVDHNITSCKILFTNLKEELTEIYKLPDKYIPGLIIQTSDTGFSANKIGPYWRSDSGNSFIDQNEYIYIKHKGDVSLDDILDELPNLFLKYQNTLKRFAELLTIEIQHPITVLKKVCKHIGIAKKHSKILVELLERDLDESTAPYITAYDVCKKILELPEYIEREHRVDIQEKVGKAININYEKFDREEK